MSLSACSLLACGCWLLASAPVLTNFWTEDHTHDDEARTLHQSGSGCRNVYACVCVLDCVYVCVCACVCACVYIAGMAVVGWPGPHSVQVCALVISDRLRSCGHGAVLGRLACSCRALSLDTFRVCRFIAWSVQYLHMALAWPKSAAVSRHPRCRCCYLHPNCRFRMVCYHNVRGLLLNEKQRLSHQQNTLPSCVRLLWLELHSHSANEIGSDTNHDVIVLSAPSAFLSITFAAGSLQMP